MLKGFVCFVVSASVEYSYSGPDVIQCGPTEILRKTLANQHQRHNMTQERRGVNVRCECVTRKPVLL
jgi:hypothetical protein